MPALLFPFVLCMLNNFENGCKQALAELTSLAVRGEHRGHVALTEASINRCRLIKNNNKPSSSQIGNQVEGPRNWLDPWRHLLVEPSGSRGQDCRRKPGLPGSLTPTKRAAYSGFEGPEVPCKSLKFLSAARNWVIKPSDVSRAENLKAGSWQWTKGCEVYRPIAIPITSQLCASQKIKENIYILTNSFMKRYSFLETVLVEKHEK